MMSEQKTTAKARNSPQYEGPALFNEQNHEAFYKVERILSSKVVDGQKMYLVKWVGWPQKFATWQPHENISHLSCFTKNFLKKRNRSRSKQRVASEYDELARLTTGLSGNANQKTSNQSATSLEDIGHFLYGDVPRQIVQIIPANKEKNKKPIIEVEWQERRQDNSSGRAIKPHNSFFTINEVMEFAPRFLFEQLQGLVVLEKA